MVGTVDRTGRSIDLGLSAAIGQGKGAGNQADLIDRKLLRPNAAQARAIAEKKLQL
jgi:hypothetical protein